MLRAYTNGSVSFEWTDEATVLVEKDGEVITYTSGALLTADGHYTITFENFDGFKAVYEFTIDTANPLIEVEGGAHGKSATSDVKVTFAEEDLTAEIFKDGESMGEYKSETVITESGDYTIVVTDLAGNETEVQFVIDKFVDYEINVNENGLANSVTVKTNADEKTLGKGCYGLCNHKKKQILLLEGMSDLQTVSTMVHESGHALAHGPYRSGFEGLTAKERREIKEVEAESIACVVCFHLGLDTENFNFSYISGWADGDISKFRKNMDVIGQYSGELIGGISNAFEQDRIAKREAAKKAEEEKAKAAEVKPVKKKTKRAVKQSEAVAV